MNPPETTRPDPSDRPDGQLVVVWRVTERCDTACGFCAYDVTLRRTRHDADPAEVLRFGTLAADWTRARERSVLLSFLGGEPFLWPGLAEVADTLRQHGAALAVTTNGRALQSARWRRFAGTLDELTVSLDGPPEVHDVLRSRPGSGAAVLEALAALRAERVGNRPRLRVNTVLMRDNVARFPELVRLVAAAGADELTFNALGGRDRPEFYPHHALRPQDVDAFCAAFSDVRGEAASQGLALSGSPGYLARLRAWASCEALPVDDCRPGQDFWFVEVDHTLAPCSFLSIGLSDRPSTSVGDANLRSRVSGFAPDFLSDPSAGVPIESLRTPGDLDDLPARLAAIRCEAKPHVCDDCPSTQQHGKWRV